jgi:pimeloyl-ACP methyl ester carboxylesterase
VVPERVDDAATGLYYEVWENKLADGAVQVAIVFRGTKFTSLKDWRANLRWFLRFLPGKDQYDVVRESIVDVVERARQRHGAHALIVATGHSLGGGLAQQAAYAHPEIKQVYAFAPSPVTGFRSVPAPQRDHNRIGITVLRIFEHGEILAYLRLVLKYVVPLSLRDARIMEVRLNLRDGDPVGQHSMTTFALDLERHAKSV